MKTSNLLLLLTGFGILSCNSPLLEHAQAEDPQPRTGQTERESACPLSFPKYGLCAELTWSSPPSGEAPGEFMLRFWSANSAGKEGPFESPADAVHVMLWMPFMGHPGGRLTFGPARDAGSETIPGVYRGTNVDFFMPGKWQVKIQLTQGTTVIEEASLDVQI